jgi:hypothetical protein
MTVDEDVPDGHLISGRLLLICDEASEGLSPEQWSRLAEILESPPTPSQTLTELLAK